MSEIFKYHRNNLVHYWIEARLATENTDWRGKEWVETTQSLH